MAWDDGKFHLLCFEFCFFIKLAQLILRDNLAVVTAYALWAISYGAFSVFLMIRMYELQTLWCLILGYSVFAYFNKVVLNYKHFIMYTAVATMAILTHYFSLIFIFLLCCIIAWQYLTVTKNIAIVVKYAAARQLPLPRR